MDAFYTPIKLANKLVRCCSLKKATSVADFAAGDGRLLRAAQSRWPEARFTAIEINKSTADQLRDESPGWRVINHDFTEFNNSSLENPIESLSIILLNPPFTCRGKKFKVDFEGETISSSYGLAFVIRALKYLSQDGELVALLPSASLSTQTDSLGWQLLRCHFKISVFAKNSDKTFEDCSPETVIVRFRRRNKPVRSRKIMIRFPQNLVKSSAASPIRVCRGHVPVNGALNGTLSRLPFIHTTDLTKDFPNWKRQVRDTYSSIRGPAVLVPRVGRPCVDKVKLLVSEQPIVLSDCVIAILCVSPADAVIVRQLIIDNWDHFQKLYNGTCAKFITLEAVRKFLIAGGLILSS